MSSVKMANSPVVIKVNVKTAGTQLEKRPIEITENGEYTPPKGVTYDPIIVTAKAKDEPLTIAENNTEIVVPDGVRYTPITVEIPENYQEKSVLPTKQEQVIVADEGYNALSQVVVEPIPDDYVLDSPELHPTLNAPTISLNANGGYLNVSDYRNGNFTDFYRLYLNGEDTGKTFTEKLIVMAEYGIETHDEITIQATAENFNPSNQSNATSYGDYINGTVGLQYDGYNFMGLGTSTSKDIYIATTVNGATIVAVGDEAFYGLDGYIVRIPDTIWYIALRAFMDCNNTTVIFGNHSRLEFGWGWSATDGAGECFLNAKNMVLDFSATPIVPTVYKANTFDGFTGIIIVPDDKYDTWITATNLVQVASNIVKASEFQGGVV